MTLEDKARRLVANLQTLIEEAQSVDKTKSPVSEKLSTQEIRVLRTVGRQDCCTMSGIANSICLSLSSVTGLIDRLVEKRLVKRDRSADDRRVVQVEFTDEGRDLNEAATARQVDFARDLLKGLNAEEQDALVALMNKVAARIAAEKKPA